MTGPDSGRLGQRLGQELAAEQSRRVVGVDPLRLDSDGSGHRRERPESGPIWSRLGDEVELVRVARSA